MDPQRKRKIRLVVALSVAVLLAVALVYTSFSASSEAKEPSELLSAAPGSNYELTGKVVKGSVAQQAKATASASGSPIAKAAARASRSPTAASIPDPFRGGREIVLSGEVEHGTFVGERDTLVTKCPSKFTTANDS